MGVDRPMAVARDHNPGRSSDPTSRAAGPTAPRTPRARTPTTG